VTIIERYEEGIDVDNNNIYVDDDRITCIRDTGNSKHMDGC